MAQYEIQSAATSFKGQVAPADWKTIAQADDFTEAYDAYIAEFTRIRSTPQPFGREARVQALRDGKPVTLESPRKKSRR